MKFAKNKRKADCLCGFSCVYIYIYLPDTVKTETIERKVKRIEILLTSVIPSRQSTKRIKRRNSEITSSAKAQSP